ncbi:MAG: cytochrome c biogenesis protein CcdA [Ilumatobacteraceae bacterium]|nr:cytochrome c biogenesis protein CcdA [Ilumatobacteraceae bacterium]
MEVLLLPIAAVVAGFISFSSPCCLPLIPGYLSYMSSLPVSELGRREARGVALRASVLFVAGFTTVFTALGVSAALVGSVLLRNLPVIVRVSGVIIIVMGLSMLGIFRIPLLYRERRLDLARIPAGPRSAFPLGMAFAFGWAPCIGPVLATILATAAASQTVAWGGALLMLYSLGLGLPFIALALGFHRARGSLSWLRHYGRTIEAIGGVMLVVVGIMFVTGVWRAIFIPLQRMFAEFGWPPI